LVWRPLLPLTKDLVFEFAHRYGVPYFRDTTPDWSTRGKLRNRLVGLVALPWPRATRFRPWCTI
jgi:tRNA(Ile)-lysidine synthase TilS/MesJ